jgi:hypothetical protein
MIGEVMDSTVQRNTGKRLPPNAGKGRKKGVPNKVTKSVREAIEAAFQSVGGEQYLAEQARSNPTGFLALLGKLLPSGASVNVGVQINEDGRQPFEAILERALHIQGGTPDWKARTHEQIGALYQRWAAGEPLPEQIILGGLQNPFEVEEYLIRLDGPVPEGVTVTGGDHGFVAVPRKCKTVEEWMNLIPKGETNGQENR